MFTLKWPAQLLNLVCARHMINVIKKYFFYKFSQTQLICSLVNKWINISWTWKVPKIAKKLDL